MRYRRYDMAKRFVFRNPEQLKAIVELCKDGSASKVMNVARVWRRSAMVHQTEVQFLPSPQMLRGHCIAVQSDGF